jgi:DNA-directed RNA polymerase specialized sigma24 family protein
MTTFAGGAPGRPNLADLDDLHEAFRSVHAERLHGFAILLTLGDRQQAGYLAAEALAAGALQHDDLRHPERAAAWLRARVLRHLRVRRSQTLSGDRRATLAALGLSDPAIDALAVLTPVERAAIIAERVEYLGPLDIATVVDQGGRRLGRMLARARTRYANAFAAADASEGGAAHGPLATRIRAIADRMMT